MAYALRYYKEIKQAEGTIVRLEIHKKDSTASAIEIGAVIQSLALQIQGQQGDVDTPIIKTSLSMTFVDAQDIVDGRKNGFWEEFYTPDALMWKVILRAKKSTETSFSDVWGGYVTPDSFSEDLVYRGSVNIVARDNIGHLQDFPFDAEGDINGMITLRDLVNEAWSKIESPMSLIWNNQQMMMTGDVLASETLMNVSAFKGKNWYEVVEKTLYSYGMVMRFVGENIVQVGSLRYLPHFGWVDVASMPHIKPTFVTGAQRELVPAVKRIEEQVEYDLEETQTAPQVTSDDYTGEIVTTRLQTSTGISFYVYDWRINNTAQGGGWVDGGKPIYFNPNGYDVSKVVDSHDNEYMWLSSSAYNGGPLRYAEYSRYINASQLSLDMAFGLTYRLNDGVLELVGSGSYPTKVSVGVFVTQNGITNWLTDSGEWTATETSLTLNLEQGKMSLALPLKAYEGTVLLGVRIYYLASTWELDMYNPLYSLAFTETTVLREKNTVNSNYDERNNVTISRDPSLGPAYDKVALPGIIKNGIFRRNGELIEPAKEWGWIRGSQTQMAVYNHLQLLSFYAKPNNLISGTIVGADIMSMSVIYTWNGAEHILVSGTYNLLNGNIESAMLREFARYEDMWSDVGGGSALPVTDESGANNIDSRSGSSQGGQSYQSTTNVNIGTGGGGGTGASYLNDLLDVDTAGVTAQSVLYYNGTAWVDMSLASLLSGYAKKGTTLADYGITNAYTKGEVDSKVTELNTAIAKKADASNVYTMAQIDSKVQTINNAIALRYTKTEVDGMITTINRSISSVDNKYSSTKAWADTLASLIVNDGGNVRIKANLIVEGDSASGGVGGGTSVGISGITLNGKTYTDENGDGIIDLGTITSGLTSVSWTDVQGRPTKLSQFTNDLGLGSLAYVNSLSKSDVGLGNVENKSSATIRGEITSANVTTALGYTPYNSANFTKANIKSTLGISDWALASSKPTYTASEVGALSTSGGTLTDTLILKYNNPRILYYDASGNHLGNIGFYNNAPSVYVDANWRTLLHSGNYSDYALPLSGGTISGSLQIGKDDNTSYKHLILSRSSHAMRLNNIADAGYLSFGAYSGGTYTAEKILEIGDYGLRYSANGGSTYYTLIHSGNIGEYKAGGIKYKDKITSQSDLDNFLEGHTFKIAQFGNISSLGFAYDDGVIMSIPWSSATEGVQLAFDESRTSPKMLMRAMSGSTWSDWKTIAFTDSNVASAYKLVDASGNDAVLITSNGSANLGLNSDGRGYILYNSANYGMIGEATGGSPRVVLSGWGGVKLRTGGKDALVVNTSGNVTIGASDLASTNYQLYVNDKIGAGLYYFAKNKTNYGYIGLASSANNDITISTDATSKLWLNGNGNTIMNYYGGNVLIGTSTDDNSGAKLQVNGDMNIPTEKAYQTNGLNAITLRASYGLYIGYGTSESYDTVIWGKDTKFVSGTNGQQRMCILNNGNVGIGTASPAYKLDVNGTARISGAVTMSSTLSVAGATTINGALTAGATTINGNLIVKGDVASA